MRPVLENATFSARDQAGAVVPEGRAVTALELDRGRMVYVDFCASCHGLNGDGKGRDAQGMRPPPRDLRRAAFKFAAVRSGELPNDADLLRVLRHGLSGTQMPGWGLDAEDASRVNDYLKTFPPVGCDPGPQNDPAPCAREGLWLRRKADGRPKLKTGEPLSVTPDPWADRDQEAIRRGEAVYHLTAQCASCHPAYMDPPEIAALAHKMTGKADVSLREDPRSPLPVAADKNPLGIELYPPDFTRDTLRTVRRGTELADLYLVIAAGVGGTMPAWVDALSQEDLWATAHYVNSKTKDRRE